jgi:plastocyanin
MQRHSDLSFVLLLLATVLLVALPAGSGPVRIADAQTASAASRTVTVLVGGGQDTIVVDSYLPQTLRIRVGDTILWKFNGDENHHFHTVTFSGGSFPGPTRALTGGRPGEVRPGPWVPVPGGQPGELMRNPVEAWPTRKAGAPIETYDGTTFVNSGHMRFHPRVAGMPAAKEFALTFTKPGVYHYACALHPHMQGTIEVVRTDAGDVQSQAQIDTQAKAETDYLLALIGKARELGKTPRSEPGPNGSSFWFVRAAAFDPSGEMRGLLFDFLPKNLSVKAGDTVIWEYADPHTVTFNPTPPTPEPFIVRPHLGGPPLLIQNPKVDRPFKPAAAYDPMQYFNSGVLGNTVSRGSSWALTFDKPGVYEYICALHEPMGMKGTITVVQR